MSSSSYEHADIPSASYTTSDNVEMSRDEDEKKTSTADALSMSHTNETSPSFEELQNLAGGADIEVVHLFKINIQDLLKN